MSVSSRVQCLIQGDETGTEEGIGCLDFGAGSATGRCGEAGGNRLPLIIRIRAHHLRYVVGFMAAMKFD